MRLLNSIEAPIDHASAIRSPWGKRQAVGIYEVDVRIANSIVVFLNDARFNTVFSDFEAKLV